MLRRQTLRPPVPLPTRWLMTDERMGDRLWAALGMLPRGSGIVFRHYGLDHAARIALFARISRIARRRGLLLIRGGDKRLMRTEAGVHNHPGRGLRSAAVHSAREAMSARRRGADLIFVSPIFATRSHRDVRPLGPLRAAAIARTARIPAIALGGMTERRLARLRRLGFYGWAGIDAWITSRRSDQKRKAVPI